MMKIAFLKVLGQTEIFENNQAKTSNYKLNRAVREAV